MENMATTRPRIKPLSRSEQEFVRLLEEVGLGSVEAARKAFQWRCEKGSKEEQKAKDLARSARMKIARRELKQKLDRQAKAENIVSTAGKVNLDRIRDFAYKRLVEIRDDIKIKSQTRFQAIKALEKLHDPSSDINLIYKWIDVVWRSFNAHCPCCHETFPLYKVTNAKLNGWRRLNESEPDALVESDYDRRLEVIKRADRRIIPHTGQVKALSAPERHIAGLGPARGGKSALLSMFALLAFLIPGVEIWILARVYEDARSEVEYLRRFIKSLFYPYHDLMVREYEDKKSGELAMISEWGSELRVRSAKAKGSITGRALEVALIAEPGWVPADLYEELRARMSERLGRIIALGTPKGTEGFIGRMAKMTGRDPKTKRIIRKTPQERLLSSGCPWNVSMLVYTLDPKDNPSYVQSELDAARQELTDAEYESEFEGKMSGVEGAKFPHVLDEHLIKIPRSFFENAVYTLGIDQGPTNFGSVLVAWDGTTAVPCYEFFDSSENTMKRNLQALYRRVPQWIQKLGGDPNRWVCTITDRDPPVWQIMEEMETEGETWPTTVHIRHKNQVKLSENWRRETAEWINNLSKRNRLLFYLADDYASDLSESAGASLLHDQVQTALDKPENPEKESKSDSDKGWIINDPWRGDHCVDAFLFAMWSIFFGHVLIPEKLKEVLDPQDPWAEHKAAFAYDLARREKEELRQKASDDLFESFFGRHSTSGGGLMGGYYGDES